MCGCFRLKDPGRAYDWLEAHPSFEWKPRYNIAPTLLVFIVFAITFLKEKLAWNYLVAFAFLGVAAFFAFAFKAPGPAI